jgi:hypothetical protein
LKNKKVAEKIIKIYELAFLFILKECLSKHDSIRN